MGSTRGVVVLVEGPSHVAALEAVLRRAGLPRGVEVRSMGGVTNIRSALATVLALEAAPRVLGLCDEGEVDVVLRAVRAAEAVGLLHELGLQASFERFRRQPAWRGRDLGASLARFAGAGSGRKVRLGRALAEALPPHRLPPPIAALLEQVGAATCDPSGPALGTFPR